MLRPLTNKARKRSASASRSSCRSALASSSSCLARSARRRRCRRLSKRYLGGHAGQFPDSGRQGDEHRAAEEGYQLRQLGHHGLEQHQTLRNSLFPVRPVRAPAQLRQPHQAAGISPPRPAPLLPRFPRRTPRRLRPLRGSRERVRQLLHGEGGPPRP